MYDESKIQESLEFCHDIDRYYKSEKRKKEPIEKKSVTCDNADQASFIQQGKEKTSFLFKAYKEICIFILCVLLAYGIASFINEYCVYQTSVEGISMEDTLFNKNSLLIDKLTYRFHDPKRFDIIVFPYEYNVFYIKRLIGMPGETIQIKNGVIYINGTKLEESYGKEKIENAGIASEPITLGKDEYFVLGDNRNHSFDSREVTIGILPKSKIIGRAWMRIFPFNKITIF